MKGETNNQQSKPKKQKSMLCHCCLSNNKRCKRRFKLKPITRDIFKYTTGKWPKTMTLWKFTTFKAKRENKYPSLSENLLSSTVFGNCPLRCATCIRICGLILLSSLMGTNWRLLQTLLASSVCSEKKSTIANDFHCTGDRADFQKVFTGIKRGLVNWI